VSALPPEPVCRSCGAPAEVGQEYCLECGNRIVPARRVPAVAAWILPSVVALVVATAGAAAAIAATHDHARRGSGAVVAVSPLHPAPAAPVVPPVKPKPHSKPQKATKLIAWPAGNGYSIILATIPLSQGATAARAKALAAVRAGLPQVGVLVSSSFASLQAGYYMVFSGVYASLAEAQSSLDAAKGTFPGAYARPVVR
jgi:hypothetical protein